MFQQVTLLYWKEKSAEEIRQDGLDCGNYKIEIGKNRNGAVTEEEDYIEEYKSKAKTYVKFFSKINDGKLKSDKLLDINIHNKDNVKEIKNN